MNEDLQKQVAQLVQAAMQGNAEATKQIETIMQMAQMIQQVMQKAKSAKYGSKLDYVKKLKGKCPEGQELKQKGGKMVCMPCMKKKK